MIRSILLVLAEAPYDASAKNYAFWLARKEGSRIHALSVIDIAAFEVPMMGAPDGFMPSVVTPSFQDSQSLMNDLTEIARERLDQFAAQCASRGIPSSAEAKTGIPGELVSRAAIAHDIVVVSRSGYSHSAGVQNAVDALVAPMIRGSVRPVLVAGSEFREESDICNILVAYDGSAHAARSLLVVAELAARPGANCTLVTVAQSEELGSEILAPAEEFLCHHNITPEKQIIINSKPSDIICGLTASGGVDIVIMGAYGHGPIREVLFGSTTERILAHCAAGVILQS
jgi:nucleotide-binding universal stress UspA family protein